MKLTTFLSISPLLACAAGALFKPVVVSYDKSTPDHVISEAMDAIRETVILREVDAICADNHFEGRNDHP